MYLGLLIAFVLALSATAGAQACPRQDPAGAFIDSAPVTLAGKVVFHDDLRHWLSVDLAKPVCGERVVQLLEAGGGFSVGEQNSKALERYRGCNVRVAGTLGVPGTGYYSAELYLNVAEIAVDAGCLLRSPFHDYSSAKPIPGLDRYSVAIKIDWRYPGGHMTAAAFQGHRRLLPWQAYADYFLTGSFVFTASCAEGFHVGRIWGTQAAKPEHLFEPGTAEDRAVIDVYARPKRVIKLNFNCVAER